MVRCVWSISSTWSLAYSGCELIDTQSLTEAASRMDMDGCVTNKLTTLSDYDTSGYFNKGFIANHFGSLRSEAGMGLALQYLAQ